MVIWIKMWKLKKVDNINITYYPKSALFIVHGFLDRVIIMHQSKEFKSICCFFLLTSFRVEWKQRNVKDERFYSSIKQVVKQCVVLCFKLCLQGIRSGLEWKLELLLSPQVLPTDFLCIIVNVFALCKIEWKSVSLLFFCDVSLMASEMKLYGYPY